MKLVRLIAVGPAGALLLSGCRLLLGIEDPEVDPTLDAVDASVDAPTSPGPGDASSEPAHVRRVATGPFHSCAILHDGRVKCWGANAFGALGIADRKTRGDGQPGGSMGKDLPAVELGKGRTAIDIALGGDPYLTDAGAPSSLATCALLDDGTVKCWGDNTYGQLGQGHTRALGGGPNEMGDALPPIDLGGKALAVTAGLYHACALLEGGQVKCWGSAAQGQIGTGDARSRGGTPGDMGEALLPVDLGTNGAARTIAAGGTHTCALLADGRVKCWGSNAFGQLGLHTNETHGGVGGMGDALPAVDLIGKAVAVAAGFAHTCALLESDALVCWGYNAFGQLGLGDTLDRGGAVAGGTSAPFPSTDLGGAAGSAKVAVSAGSLSTCALFADHRAKCWGSNVEGLLGLPSVPVRGSEPDTMGDLLPFLARTDLTQLAVAYKHVCAVANDRALCWGLNAQGQLGLGDTRSRGANDGDLASLPFVDLGP